MKSTENLNLYMTENQYFYFSLFSLVLWVMFPTGVQSITLLND